MLLLIVLLSPEKERKWVLDNIFIDTLIMEGHINSENKVLMNVETVVLHGKTEVMNVKIVLMKVIALFCRKRY